MVTMSSSFTLPPVIRRFGRCGEWEQRMPSSSPSSSEIGEQSSGESNIYSTSNEVGGSKPKSYGGGGGADRVKSFVHGIVSPFAACWQPTDPCGPVQCSDRVFRKQPSVVSPHLDRVIAYRDSRVEHTKDRPAEDYYSHPHPHPHSHRHVHHRNYHRMHPTTTAVHNFSSSRREPAAATLEESTITTEKKKRNTDIAKPLSNDILCGRGGSSNRHLGNIHFRELVAANKQVYVGLTKKQKMLVARKIVDAIHTTGGRFLAKDLDTGMFYDIGLPRSLEKTSQALREKHSNEMTVQQGEGEGIETSVESHNSLIKANTDTDGSKGTVEESPAEIPSSSKSASTSTAKISKSSSSNSNNNNKTEAPDLIIPSHLMDKFGPKGSSTKEEDWESTNQSNSLSHSDPSYESHRSPYPPSPYRSPQQPYPASVAGHPPPAHHHHRHHRYPPSPSNQYSHPPHYYYPPAGHHPQTPPYVRRDEGYSYPDHGSDYYQRQAPHAHYHRYPRPATRHHGHPIPHVSPPHAPSRGAPPPPPHSGYASKQVSSPPQLPQYRPSPQSSYYRYEGDGTPKVPRRGGSSSSASPASRIIYRNTNSGYVRGNSELSPGRQRELKRPRNGEGEATTISPNTTGAPTQASEVSLSSAVKHSLSLDDRVVGKERAKLQQKKESSSSGTLNLISPSTMLQAKSFSRASLVVENDRASPTETKEQDYSALSGLAALSTAAFLKLDEDDDMK